MKGPNRLLIVGSSGHAKVVIDVVEKIGDTILGLVDSFRVDGEETLGHPVLGSVDDLPRLVRSLGATGAFIAIGDNYSRGMVANRICDRIPSLSFVSLVHPSALIARDVEIGDGTIVMAGAVVNPSARIGRFCIVNSAATLEHDSVMEDFSSLAPGARTGGDVRIGHFTAVGIGATITHKVRIGAHTIIGAGATVTRDIEGYRVAYGVPARVVRERREGERYL